MTSGPSRQEERRHRALNLPLPPLELWGGIECTRNRVGDRYIDQIELTGHARRESDLEMFAEIGIRTVRYPVLWERVAPGDLRDANWREPDRALGKLRELGIRPIVGLVHHGSGPLHTGLLDPRFPERLREFAQAVAERYPWVDAYTPINEPLTTARFSALYGHWYPHARDDRSFVRAFLNQCAAIRASMETIRRINPVARLIQTEDLGRTYGTDPLRYQANFDNHRRWLTFDLLTGRVTDSHPLWHFIIECGVSRSELTDFADAPCPPDIIGINYYLTSERFLDHRSDLYPERNRGGNGRDAYADVEAVRVLRDGIAGHRGVLSEATARYDLPLAITEVHLGCTREQQLRWLGEAWNAAAELRASGHDIRAVTIWALLGSFGWDSLLTREPDTYETGAFDVRGPSPRRTALAAMATGLAKMGHYDHPVLDGAGWWRSPNRISFPRADTVPDVPQSSRRERPLLIIGGTGTLGSAFARACQSRGLSFVTPPRGSLDIADAPSLEAALEGVRPWAVINASGYVRVDDAEWDRASCYRVNTEGAVNVAAACANRGLPVVSFSSDLVFDGMTERAYLESDEVNPLSVYGKSKALAEAGILALRSAALVVRTSAFFGPRDSYNFLTQALASIANGVPVEAAPDVWVSPTYVPDLVSATLDLLIDGERGIWHLANRGAVTWAELARRGALAAGLSPELVVDSADGVVPGAARPKFSVLASERGRLMPSLDDALSRYMTERARSSAPSFAGRGWK
ncbi:MAG TPA: family 1 glycosylhydrolase [Gemmatimonadaceae bacterium]|nr:family 1 glycosylhydrolase [Gemmatimonadaceae bacterium]